MFSWNFRELTQLRVLFSLQMALTFVIWVLQMDPLPGGSEARHDSEAELSVTGGDRRKETLGEGDYFLSETLTTRAAPAPATYTSNGGVACVLVDRTRLRELVEFRNDDEVNEPSVELHELKVLATLGVGGFGRVKMVVGPSGRHYALKCMYKGRLAALSQVERVLEDRISAIL